MTTIEATQATQVTKALANNVLYHFGYVGYPGGSFFTKLMDMCRDVDNPTLDKLAAGFPAEVAAYRLMKHDHVDVLKAAAIGTAS